MSEHLPLRIVLHTASRELELSFEEGICYHLPAEFLRVHSPSAEVRGHGRGEGQLQTGKRHARILRIEPSGRYALKIFFDDGHHSGLYTWDYLYDLCQRQETYWARYLSKLEAAGASRDPVGDNDAQDKPTSR